MDRTIQVLIVEDNLATCALLRAFLEREEGVALCGEAHNGWEGLEILQERQVDLVLLDLVMPGMDGMGFLAALQKQCFDRRPKVLILSGIGSDEFVQRAIRLGANYYLIKPVLLEELASRVKQLFPTETQPLQKIDWILFRLGANKDCQGFGMACRGAALLGGEEVKAQLKEIYLLLAAEFGTSWSCVERNLRTTVRQIHSANTPFYRDVLGFGAQDKPPDNGAFLRALARML